MPGTQRVRPDPYAIMKGIAGSKMSKDTSALRF